jgi:putative chitinase
MALLKADLLKLFPDAKQGYLDALERNERLLTEHGILADPLCLCHFLAQAAHECGGFEILSENGNYSAQRLREVWPNRFTEAQARAYAHKPQAILSRAYARKELGNGSEASGDGWKYRGRGMFQTTGKYNYGKVAKLTGVDVVADPDKLCTDFTLSLKAALMEWSNLDLGRIARELGPTHEAVLKIARGINVGNVNSGAQPNGLADRKALFEKIWHFYGKTHVVPKLDPAADGVLEEGEEGQAVRELQEALAHLGYPVGEANGIYGPRTASAVAAFQMREGLGGRAGKWEVAWAPKLVTARAFENADRQDATAKDLAGKGNIAVGALMWIRRAGAGALAFFGIDTAADKAGVQLPETFTGLKQVVDPLASNLQWLAGSKWVLGIALGLGLVALSSVAIKAIVSGYRSFNTGAAA